MQAGGGGNAHGGHEFQIGIFNTVLGLHKAQFRLSGHLLGLGHIHNRALPLMQACFCRGLYAPGIAQGLLDQPCPGYGCRVGVKGQCDTINDLLVGGGEQHVAGQL